MHRVSPRRLDIALWICVVLLAAVPDVATAERLLVLGPSGGPGGGAFADLHPDARVVEIQVRSGAFIDGVRLVYQVGGNRVEGPWHGGGGGTLSRFDLAAGESIVAIGGRSGKFVDSLWIRTDRGRERRWGGDGGAHAYRYTAPAGGRLAGLWGRSGVSIDAIGPAFTATGGSIATASLDGFAASGPSVAAGPGGGKSDTVNPKSFPKPTSAPGSSGWDRELADQLGGIVRALSGSSSAFSSYKQKEAADCGQEVHCQIWWRQAAISYVVSGGE